MAAHHRGGRRTFSATWCPSPPRPSWASQAGCQPATEPGARRGEPGDAEQLLRQDRQQTVHSESEGEEHQAEEDVAVKRISLFLPNASMVKDEPNTPPLTPEVVPAASLNLPCSPCLPATTSSASSSATQSSPAPQRHRPVEEQAVSRSPAKRGRKVSSFVWEHFLRNPTDKCTVQCKHCRRRVRLGREGKVGTTCMHRHLQHHHDFLLLKKATLASPPPLASSAAFSTAVRRALSPALAARTTTQLAPRETWPPIAPQAMERNRWLAEFLAKGMHPLALVDQPAFRELLQRLVPQWKVPGRKYFLSTAVPALGESIRAALKSSLKDCVGGSAHIAADVWTSCQAQAYMSVTAHWMVHDSVAGCLGRRKAVIDVSGFGGAPTAAGIAHKLKAVIDSWLRPLGIATGYVAAGTAPVIMEALRDSGMKHVPPMAHCLDVAVTSSLAKASAEVQEALKAARVICGHFQRCADAQNKLREVQRQYAMPPHRLVQDVAVLWNSTLCMVRGLCEQRWAITECSKGNGDLQLTPRQWGLLKELSAALRPFEEVTRLLTTEDSTLGQVLPLLRFVEKILVRLKQAAPAGSPSCLLLAELFAQLRTSRQLKRIQGNIVYWAASYLDPRFRDTFGNYVGGAQDPVHGKLEEVKDYLLAEVLEAYLGQTCDSESPSAQKVSSASTSWSTSNSPSAPQLEETTLTSPLSSTDGAGLWFSFSDEMGLTATGVRRDQQGERLRSNGVAIARQELEAYAKDDVGDFASPKSVPVRYWESKRHAWPSLHTVAVRYLACPPTSGSTEQLFSTAGRVLVDSSRTRGNANVLCFIRMNQDWIPQDPSLVPSEVLARRTNDAQEHYGKEAESEEDSPMFQRAVFEAEDCL